MKKLYLAPVKQCQGEIFIPGSKSISNRALLLAALANGSTKLSNLLYSDDTKHMQNALTKLGIHSEFNNAEQTECTIQGTAGVFAWQDDLTLYLGNAGTAMRSLTAILTLKNTQLNNESKLVLTGDARMQERPIYPLIDALTQIGAKITYQQTKGYPPIAIYNYGLQGGELTIDGSLSSQYVTALLITLPLAPKDSIIKVQGDLVSKPYIDITLAMMQDFGVSVTHDNYQQFTIQGGQQYQAPQQYYVESDASSASYFLAAAAIKGTITIHGVGKNSIQGDKYFADVLMQMGAKVEWAEHSITVTQDTLHGIDVDLNHIPDAAMTIAIVALFAQGTTTIRNIYNWRIKETDRLAAMSTELRKVGAIVEEGHDYISITPPTQLQHAEIATYNDHRIAMCFSLLAFADSGITILDPDCTSKTYPNYFSHFQQVCIK